jgi:hypothetical protein
MSASASASGAHIGGEIVGNSARADDPPPSASSFCHRLGMWDHHLGLGIRFSSGLDQQQVLVGFSR